MNENKELDRILMEISLAIGKILLWHKRKCEKIIDSCYETETNEKRVLSGLTREHNDTLDEIKRKLNDMGGVK